MKVKILSSHIIRSDIHKSSIISALNNPINVELVKQLNEYVDWEDINELDDQANKEKDEEHSSNIEDDNRSKKDDSENEEIEQLQENEIDETDKEDSQDEIEEIDLDKDENIESSTNIAETIISSLQEKLNASEICKGVNLVSCKRNEIWVRYDDNINLNDIMYDAIKCVTDISPLTFNRLARFDNSIVFIK